MRLSARRPRSARDNDTLHSGGCALHRDDPRNFTRATDGAHSSLLALVSARLTSVRSRMMPSAATCTAARRKARRCAKRITSREEAIADPCVGGEGRSLRSLSAAILQPRRRVGGSHSLIRRSVPTALHCLRCPPERSSPIVSRRRTGRRSILSRSNRLRTARWAGSPRFCGAYHRNADAVISGLHQWLHSCHGEGIAMRRPAPVRILVSVHKAPRSRRTPLLDMSAPEGA
jgi:hypothetical protein